jgi:uncharacterized protein YllA (UPF0747 family)
MPFPILLPRNFALVVGSSAYRKLEKTGLKAGDFFESKNFLYNHWVTQNTHHDLKIGPALNEARAIYNRLNSQATAIDKTLEALVGAEAKRVQNGLEKIERKLLKAEKRLHADRLRQIDEVKDSLFPGGGLQERTDNLLDFYQENPNFIAELLERLDPFDFKFNILINDDKSRTAEKIS